MLLALVAATVVLAAAPAASDARPVAVGARSNDWFGPIVQGNFLSNTRIGGPYGTVLAYGFQAAWTGRVSAVRFYAVVNDSERQGYSDGTGGTLRVSIVGARGGRRPIPGQGSLAKVDYTPPTKDSWPLVRFPHPARVTAGRRYYVVFTNIDPDPLHNYASINALVSNEGGASPPPLPDHLDVLLGDSTDGGATPIRWRTRVQHPGDVYLPIIDIRGTRKSEDIGLGYMESWVTDPKPIGGTSAVRERFVFVAARAAQVGEARVRVRRTLPAATPLQVRLETLSGQVLAEADIPASGVGDALPTWVVARFANHPEIRPGMTLALVLRSEAPGSYEAFPLRDGSDFGFAPQTVFRAGYAEFTSGGDTWTGWDQWGEANRHDGDLQFALQLRA